MQRFMLDSNVFDQLLLHPDATAALHALRQQGEVELLRTRVQREQLGDTPDERKRSALLALMEDLTVEVDTVGFWEENARWDVHFWAAEDFDTVLRTSGAETKDGEPGHTKDALMGLLHRRSPGGGGWSRLRKLGGCADLEPSVPTSSGRRSPGSGSHPR